MMPSIDYYTDLITSEHRLATKFKAMVQKMVRYNTKIDTVILNLVESFDIDNAHSHQLDILGDCVGVSRTLNFEPTPAGTGEIISPTVSEMAEDNQEESVYTIHKTPTAVNLKETDIIQGYSSTEMNDEPLITDEVYRIMIKAKIIQNIWKGNVLDLYTMWDALFPENLGIQIQDLQDMSYNIVLLGNYTGIMRELILHGYIIPKPQGVRINMLSFISLDGLPIFAYDYKTLNYYGYTSHWIQTKEI